MKTNMNCMLENHIFCDELHFSDMNRVDGIFWVTERMGISTKSQISNDLYKMVVLPKGASGSDTKIGSNSSCECIHFDGDVATCGNLRMGNCLRAKHL